MNRYVLMAGVLVLWGLWGLLPKLAVAHLSPKSALVYQSIGGLLVGLAVLAAVGFRPDAHPVGATYSVAAGAMAMLGSLLLLQLLRTETATVAITVTALYPIVTIILAAVVLGEAVTLRQGIGIVLSFVAIAFIAG